MISRLTASASCAALLLGLGSAGSAYAASEQDLASEVKRLREMVEAQAARLNQQEAALAAQGRRISAQQSQIENLRHAAGVMTIGDLEVLRGTGLPSGAMAAQALAPALAAPATTAAAQQVQPIPQNPVGEAPPERAPVPVEAVPDWAGVLTRRGGLVFEPSFEFTRASSNRLVFRGLELTPGIQIGIIEANDADRTTLSAAAAVRYGLTDRLEIEARVPYVYRDDRVTTVQASDQSISKTFELEGNDIGDVEAALRYQLNNIRPNRPIFLASLRVKSDTGTGPFDIERDQDAAATELATGSGFWGVEPGISMLFPTDPAVIFANISYLAHLAADVDMQIGDVYVGRVNPGDSIGLSAGFGFALNERFSYSMGYRHNYIFETTTEIGDNASNVQEQSSNDLHVGAFLFGMSYRFTDKVTLSGTFEFGVTSDAPDTRVLVRVPIRF